MKTIDPNNDSRNMTLEQRRIIARGLGIEVASLQKVEEDCGGNSTELRNQNNVVEFLSGLLGAAQ